MCPSSFDPDVFERLTTQWFATGGHLPVTCPSVAPACSAGLDRALPPSGGTIDLWVVGHDERGGTAMPIASFMLQ